MSGYGAGRGMYPVPTFRDGCRDCPWAGNENVADRMNIPSGKGRKANKLEHR